MFFYKRKLISIAKFSTMEKSINEKIKNALNPAYFEIINDSKKHKKGDESHFILKIVSNEFERTSKIERHQKVYSLLQDEFSKGLHSLNLVLKSEEEWNIEKSLNAKKVPCYNNENK